MVFNPKDKSKVVCNNFVCFSVDGKPMQFVTEFKYLGHVITCSLSDDKDLLREMRNHRLNGSSSPVLTATSLSYGKAKNSTPTESKPLTRLR